MDNPHITKACATHEHEHRERLFFSLHHMERTLTCSLQFLIMSVRPYDERDDGAALTSKIVLNFPHVLNHVCPHAIVTATLEENSDGEAEVERVTLDMPSRTIVQDDPPEDPPLHDEQMRGPMAAYPSQRIRATMAPLEYRPEEVAPEDARLQGYFTPAGLKYATEKYARTLVLQRTMNFDETCVSIVL